MSGTGYGPEKQLFVQGEIDVRRVRAHEGIADHSLLGQARSGLNIRIEHLTH